MTIAVLGKLVERAAMMSILRHDVTLVWQESFEWQKFRWSCLRRVQTGVELKDLEAGSSARDNEVQGR